MRTWNKYGTLAKKNKNAVHANSQDIITDSVFFLQALCNKFILASNASILELKEPKKTGNTGDMEYIKHPYHRWK